MRSRQFQPQPARTTAAASSDAQTRQIAGTARHHQCCVRELSLRFLLARFCLRPSSKPCTRSSAACCVPFLHARCSSALSRRSSSSLPSTRPSAGLPVRKSANCCACSVGCRRKERLTARRAAATSPAACRRLAERNASSAASHDAGMHAADPHVKSFRKFTVWHSATPLRQRLDWRSETDTAAGPRTMIPVHGTCLKGTNEQ